MKTWSDNAQKLNEYNPSKISYNQGINVSIMSLFYQPCILFNQLNNKNAFSYITVLVFVSIMGITLSAASAYWSTTMKREKEKELLFRGDQIRRAIESYYNGAPGKGGSQYPGSLKELLKDPRYLTPRKHLRKLYKDPMAVDREWGFVMVSGNRIKGVFSQSKEKPIKVGNFPAGYESFEKAETYSDWKFVYPLEQKEKTDSKNE